MLLKSQISLLAYFRVYSCFYMEPFETRNNEEDSGSAQLMIKDNDIMRRGSHTES